MNFLIMILAIPIVTAIGLVVGLYSYRSVRKKQFSWAEALDWDPDLDSLIEDGEWEERKDES